MLCNAIEALVLIWLLSASNTGKRRGAVLKSAVRKKALNEIDDLAIAIRHHQDYQEKNAQIKKSQHIVDRLKKRGKQSWYTMHVLDDPNISTLNGISFKNDNITKLTFSGSKDTDLKPEYVRHLKIQSIPRLSLDGNGSGGMNLESINGIKRWPNNLSEVGIFNMFNFSIISLKQVPKTVTVLRLANIEFAPLANTALKHIALSPNLKILSIQRCKASQAAISALDIESLSHLSELYLIYFDQMRYSEHQYPIYFPRNLQYLCIDFGLIENIMKTQRPQKLNRLKYVNVKNDNHRAVYERRYKRLKKQIVRYFNASNVEVAMYNIGDHFNNLCFNPEYSSTSSSDSD